MWARVTGIQFTLLVVSKHLNNPKQSCQNKERSLINPNGPNSKKYENKANDRLYLVYSCLFSRLIGSSIMSMTWESQNLKVYLHWWKPKRNFLVLINLVLKILYQWSALRLSRDATHNLWGDVKLNKSAGWLSEISSMHQNCGGSVSFYKSLSKETFTMDPLIPFLRECLYRGRNGSGGGGERWLPLLSKVFIWSIWAVCDFAGKSVIVYQALVCAN